MADLPIDTEPKVVSVYKKYIKIIMESHFDGFRLSNHLWDHT